MRQGDSSCRGRCLVADPLGPIGRGRWLTRGFSRSRSLRRRWWPDAVRRSPSPRSTTSWAAIRPAGSGRSAVRSCASTHRSVICPRIPIRAKTSVSTFVFWVYAPEAVEGSLRFEFRKQGRTCAWVRLRTGIYGLARGLGSFRPRHAGAGPKREWINWS